MNTLAEWVWDSAEICDGTECGPFLRLTARCAGCDISVCWYANGESLVSAEIHNNKPSVSVTVWPKMTRRTEVMSWVMRAVRMVLSAEATR